MKRRILAVLLALAVVLALALPALAAVSADTAVSYTHLDVYKRQASG